MWEHKELFCLAVVLMMKSPLLISISRYADDPFLAFQFLPLSSNVLAQQDNSDTHLHDKILTLH